MASLVELLNGIQCPRCGREDGYIVREVDHVIPVEGDTLTVHITVGECTYCGERLLDEVAAKKIDDGIQ